ncbi:hypothetical protein Adt_41517 [Abeliophyllum distichum]|uniref:Uncharacterized protein n=1 Tax=Abeliophyllum distichum TaxID=126358 RepID=A0ABD1PP19_9LAMI
MKSFRKNLENIYETSQDLGLLNVILAFEDNKHGSYETIMTTRSEDEESQHSESVAKDKLSDFDDSWTDDEVIIHERFNTNRDSTLPGIEFKEPKPEKIEDDNPSSSNPKGNGKRPEGDFTPRPMPDKDID